LADLDVDGHNIRMHLIEIEGEVMDCVHLAQWQALVNGKVKVNLCLYLSTTP